MTYATQQDLVERFGAEELIQLTDRTNIPVSTIDAVVVGRALSDASAFIDGFVQKVARLPLSPVPDVLTKIAADIARYYLHGKSADKDSPVTRAYVDANTYLLNVSKGLVALVAQGEEPPAAGSGSVQAVAPDRVFTRESLRSF